MAKKVDGRKKVKLTIEITEHDLDLFEDHNMCIPSCNKHKGIWDEPFDERRAMTMYYECKECEKVHNKWLAASKRIESRLWKQLGKKRGW